MAVKREFLARWRYPSNDTLCGVFPSGKPPFAPFSTVTNLVNANLCPVALYHDLLHGIDNALTGQYSLEGRGELFHQFIAHLKVSLRNGEFRLSGHDIQTQQGVVQELYLRFARHHGFSTDESSDIWRLYIEPWVRRKLQNGELENISPTDQFFFEVSVAHPRVSFPLDGGKRHYPLKGRIDEINLTRKVIIERTIRESDSDNEPPLLKDYQIWLLRELLCAMNRTQLPASWISIDFQKFSLVIETPHRDFTVPLSNSDYITNTHYTYAWINDISISESRGVFQEVFDNAECTPFNPHQKCSHPFQVCFPKKYPHPQCRPEIKQSFQPWFRLLLWEQMWEGDLWQYQLLMLEREELVRQGLIREARIISFNGNQIELEVVGAEGGSVRGYDKQCTIIPYGTLFCGLKRNARVIDTQNDHLIMRLENSESVLSQDALLLPTPSDAPPPIFSEPLTFIEERMQEDLFRLQYIGAVKQDKARQRSLIQLFESILGIRSLRRGLG